jgi:hypothetical protein
MTYGRWIKPPYLILLAYLMLAVTGFFAVPTGEIFQVGGSSTDGLNSSGFYSSISRTIDWLGEDTTTIGKAFASSSSPQRNGLFRVFMIIGIIAAVIHSMCLYFHLIKKNHISSIKNTILLKLRI